MIRTWVGPERGMSRDGSGALHGISLCLQLRFWVVDLGRGDLWGQGSRN
jgi:hypothetical protein